MSDCTFTSNDTTGYGGAIYNDWSGTLSVSNGTSISGNVADCGGGGIASYLSATISDCTISENTTNGYGGGGGIYNNGNMDVSSCTITDNQSTCNNGGGIENDWEGVLSITDSTIAGNSANYNSGGLENHNVAVLLNDSISGNTAMFGAGLSNFAQLDG